MKAFCFVLIATALACDTGDGVDRAVTSSVQDRATLTRAHADAASADVRRHHDEVLAELGAKLGLSAEQAARVQEIFARHHAEREAAGAQGHAQFQRTMQKATTEIETVLDSAQIERLHAWLAEHHGPASPHAPAHGH